MLGRLSSSPSSIVIDNHKFKPLQSVNMIFKPQQLVAQGLHSVHGRPHDQPRSGYERDVKGMAVQMDTWKGIQKESERNGG